MTLLLLALLACPGEALAALPAAPAVGPDLPLEDALAPGPREIRQARGMIPVRRAPDPKSKLRGMLAAGETFWVLERVEGPGCAGEGWARVEAGGYACLQSTRPSERVPEPLPRLVPFDPPTPEEYRSYVSTGKWERTADELAEPLLPFVYGKRWRGWEGWIYPDVKSYLRGDETLEQLEEKHKYRFERVEHTKKGDLLVLPDDRVVPLDEVYVYPTERFHGRDLLAAPVPDGMTLAWGIDYKGAPFLLSPQKDAEVGSRLPYHTELLVETASSDLDGRYHEVHDAVGPGLHGYLDNQRSIRRVIFAPPPDGIATDQLWLDVDIVQQTLVVYQGATPIYATLISSALQRKGFETPPGLYRIYDKVLHNDMASLPDASEEYYVEAVPWTMHFYPRFALHAAFWHWGFGHQASHGCVNLATLDAKWVFDRIGPALPPGWHMVYETPEDPGTLLRVRDGDKPVPDLRVPLE